MIKKITCKNGLRIVSEHIPHVRSVAVGIWVQAGSRYEKLEENGLTHFIEHMLFKGTKTRTARKLLKSLIVLVEILMHSLQKRILVIMLKS